MISKRDVPCRKSPGGILRSSSLGPAILVQLALLALLWALPALAQSPQAFPGAQLPDSPAPGSIHGTIVDPNGAPVAGARVKLIRQDQSPNQETQAGDDGQYSFVNLAPGSFQLSFTAEGFATQNSSGVVRSGENVVVPQITL
ncbi:MAG TPA: carboxypeptidase-like regulatory domain-containing protein, partial [Candidatus Acidoferrum sp.]|nr:carboxypeptidase-like regulatory domain-containing protein [Candidatus Acidoferrum sp.]